MKATEWAGATIEPIAADAGDRRYSRLHRNDGRSAIVMIAPVAVSAVAETQFQAFRRVGKWLRDLGLAAPSELGVDAAHGILLLEDLGALSFAALVEKDRAEGRHAYGAATDVLVRIARAPAPEGLDAPDAHAQAAMVFPTLTALPDDEPDAKALHASLTDALTDALSDLQIQPGVVALRDVHAENLVWRKDLVGPSRVGLLDFQDAVLLPDGYDLASLLDDPRRDIPLSWREDLIIEYAEARGVTDAEMAFRVNLLSLLRNLRIHGVFRRLATIKGRPDYARLQPRLRRLISAAAAQPGLTTLEPIVARLLERTASWSEVRS